MTDALLMDLEEPHREAETGPAAGEWRRRLEGLDPVLELPTDRPRPRAPGLRRERLAIPLGAAGWLRRIDLVAARPSPRRTAAVLAAGVAALCARLTGRRDLALGTPVAGGPGRAGLGVLRIELPGDPTFGELLDRTQRRLREADARGPVPAVLALPGGPAGPSDPARHPLVQVAVAVRGPGEPPVDEAALRLEKRLRPGAPPLDLLWLLDRSGETPTLVLEHDPDLFGAMGRRLTGGLLALLEAAVADPDLRLSALPVVAPEELPTLLREWAVVRTPYPREAGIAGLFDRQAASRPDAVAVVDGSRSVTYRELDRRSARLAARLRALGVGRSRPVALALERSLELVEAMLAVVRAGGAYVPLDAAYPAERLAFMLADVAAPVLVTREAVLPGLPVPEGTAVVVLDREGVPEAPAVAEDGAAPAPPEAAGAEDLAYVTYTSGSTGRPKGVMVPARGVVRLVENADYARFGPDETFLHLAAVTFDLTTLEVWGPLLTGGRLAVFPAEAPTPDRLADLLARERVTFLWLTAGLFHQMAEARPEGLAPVRQLLAGGDALSAAHCRRVLQACPETVLIDGYGPTENTTFSSCHPMRRPEEVSDPVSIGRPIANSEAFVLDAGLRPLPAGAPGELLVGGDGLAWGYWRRPALTAERFVPHPASDRPGDRLYRTGDLAAWRADGTLEFLGRSDHQLKLRGFRIEPGEVESALAKHPAVGEVVVAARELLGAKALVAYLVPRAGAAAPAPRELRDHVAERLPEWMVPSAFVALPELPLSPNGKVDRRALPEPGPGDRASAGDHRAPRTREEEALARIWGEVLGVPRVGLQDDFFALGGHSLLAGSILSRVADALGADLPVASLFRARTLEAFAAEVAAAGAGPAAPPVERREEGGPAPLSFTQRGLWLVERLHRGSAQYNLPYAFRIAGEGLSAAVLARCLAEVVRRHEALRTRFVPGSAGEPEQVVAPPAAPELPVVDLSGLPAAARERGAAGILAAEARRPFDLEAGPPVRSRLLRLGAADHRLVFHPHHIAFDGWSAEVLAAELRALYPALAAGRGCPLPEPPVRYRDFAGWEREWLTDEVLAPEIAHWRERLADLPPVLELPTDRPRPRRLSVAGDQLTARLEPALRRRLEELAEGEGASRFMALLAGFAALLGRWSGRDVVPVGSPVAGRARPELEGMIGLFVNTLVLRCDLSGAPSFRELLGRVRDETLAALAHGRLPFPRLVEELGAARSPSHHPVVQVLFAGQDLDPLGGELAPGLDLSAEALGTGTAKVDLTLFADRRAGGLEARFEYATDLFDRATVERLAEQWMNLLRGAAAEPDRPLAELPILPPSEEAQVLREWPAPAASPQQTEPWRGGLGERFAARAVELPDAVAVEAPGLSLTYGELARRSRALAAGLAARGVGRGTPVVLVLERSVDLVVAVLGVVRAGGAYVPLDPGYPEERQALLLSDAGSPLVITRPGLAAGLPVPEGVGVLCLDGDGRIPGEGERAAPAAPPALPDDLAYLVYTSGSTGRPKGVAVPHRGVTRLVLGGDYTGFAPGETWLHLSSVSFDAATLELWGPLLTGGRLALFPAETPSPRAVAAALARHRVTRLFLTTALFNQLAEEPEGIPPGLVHLMTGGEISSPGHFRRALEARPELLLSNVYGPTENTTFSTHHPVPAAGEVPEPLPIGRAIAGSSCWVLDRALRPAPVGVAGELLVGGEGLARGYWRRPALTAERFVPHPHAARPGERLYRTGDLVRWRPGGALEFLGRNDFQVKIRGFRIEPGEVEVALAAHPAVAEALVAVGEVAGERALVGYWVPRTGPAPEASGLRRWLEGRLPAHMVPAALVELERFPLGPTGKVDRRALPAPDRDLGTGRAAYLAPRTPLEEEIAALWRELLGVEGLGVEDDFFDLGGHSLLATRILARLGDDFGVDIPLQALFEAPTVAGLAESLGMALLDQEGLYEDALEEALEVAR